MCRSSSITSSQSSYPIKRPEVTRMEYTYDTFDKPSIRLFKAALAHDGHMQGQLATFRLPFENEHARVPPYEAISYTWGSDIYSHHVQIDGKRLPILDSIHGFLRQMLDDGSESWYWIDSISINQKNEAEKAAQVALMGRIFAKANIVRVWLGEEADDSALALTFLGFMGSGQRFSHHQNLPSQQVVDDLRAHYGPYMRHWAAVNKLFERSWWTRVWTVQEFVVAREVTLHCGNGSISRDTLQHALDAIYDCGVHLASTAQWNRARILNRYRRGLSESIIATLAYLSDHHASNPRDRLYSLSGIVKDFDLVGSPDYTQSVESLFLKFTRAFITKYRSLDVICLATTFHQEDLVEGTALPSWVPDWRRIVVPLVVPTMVSQGACSFIGNFRPRVRLDSTASYRASGYSYTRLEISNDLKELVCHGFVLGKIDGLAGLSSRTWNGTPFEGYEMIQSTENSMADEQIDSRAVSDIMQAIMRCLIMDRQDHYLNDAPSGDEFLSQLRTLLAMTRDEHPALRATFRYWYNVNKGFRIRGQNLESLARVYLEDGVVEPPHTLPDWERRKAFYSRFHDTAVKMSRRLVVMEDGLLGTAPSRALKGDVVAILFGCNVPVVLRPVLDDDAFQFGGECYIDGVMNGEALKLCPAEDHRMFKLV